MMEVDRVLRPGGYWVLSGPPINWRNNYKAWLRPKEELQEEQRKIEDIARLLCWEKKYEQGEIAIWQKRVNAGACSGRQDDARTTFCKAEETDDTWYGSILEFPLSISPPPPFLGLCMCVCVPFCGGGRKSLIQVCIA